MDFKTREALPFVQTQPLHKAQGSITQSDDTTIESTAAKIKGTKAAMNGAEVPVISSKISASHQSSGSQDPPSIQTPKVSQASSKILDRVRAFEEQSHSSNMPKVSSRLSWGFNRTSTCNSEDGKCKAGKFQDNTKSEVALKRSFFKQKASSLEEQSTYVQKNFQSKLSEELHRIKKLVGKSNIKKAFSMEQLTQTDKQSSISTESFPTQLIQKAEETGENFTNLKAEPDTKERWTTLPKEQSCQLPKITLAEKTKQPENETPPEMNKNQWKNSKPTQLLDRQVFNENVSFIPGQYSPMLPKTNVSRKWSKSPAQPMVQDGLVQAPQKPPRLLESITTLPTPFKMTIPTIVVGNKPMDEEWDQKEGQITRQNRGNSSSLTSSNFFK